MIDAYKRFLKNYANFSGRSTRGDYWWVVLANFLIGFVIGFICGILGLDTKVATIISAIYSLAVLVPGIALVVRRLHDINKSGWYYFMGLIPIVGPIIVLIYMLTDSVNENNQYGERV